MIQGFQQLTQKLSRFKSTLCQSPQPSERLVTEIQAESTTAEVEPLAWHPVQLHITNQGQEPLHRKGRFGVEIETRWLNDDHKPIIDGEHDILATTIAPGDSTIQTCKVLTPQYLGDYLLEINLKRRNSHNGDNVGTVIYLPMRVNTPLSDDCDYVAWYRQQNLSKNHWEIVGPTTMEEFAKLQQAQFQILLDQGLTPASRILDVGCGTGKLAEILLPYLNEQGCYYGSDIGKEGIEFCQQRYSRPNFHFRHSEADSIPIADQQFDMIVFFSVFTHTHADETASLLRAALRLLAPGGHILCDIFTSSLTKNTVGQRGAIEWNEDVFHAMLQRVHVEAELLSELCHERHRFAMRNFYRMKARSVSEN